MARAVARISALIEAPLYPEPSPQLQQRAEVECGQDRGITGQRGHSTGHEMLPCPWQQKVSVGITCKVKHCGTQPGWVEIRLHFSKQQRTRFRFWPACLSKVQGRTRLPGTGGE